MKKIIAIVLSLTLIFALVGCGAKDITPEKPYTGAPKIVLNGYDYFAADAIIVHELPEGYSYAGELSDEEKKYAYIDGSPITFKPTPKPLMIFMFIRNAEQESATPRSTTRKGNGLM